MRRQLGLFSVGAPAFDPGFGSARRVGLAHGAWIEHVPGWVAGHDRLFEQLEREVGWRQETMHLYDREVVVPRLLGSFRDQALPDLIEAMRAALDARYGDTFVRVTAALYRDGRDSVAFHGDTVARDLDTALVATVSLGAPRRLLLRPTEGGASVPFELGGGDLFVMGGTCQRTWRHGVPKVAHAAPRIAVMFRPRWGEGYES